MTLEANDKCIWRRYGKENRISYSRINWEMLEIKGKLWKNNLKTTLRYSLKLK